MINVGSVSVSVIATPCHTPGHVTYFVPAHQSAPGCVFTGDTLFVAGCGNFNSGTPALMHEAFNKLGALPRGTLVYAGHEYTVSNLQFASLVEPDNIAITRRLEWANAQRAQGLFTVPSTIEDEWATNPFMRVGEAAVAAYAKRSDPVDVIGEIRRLKTEWGRRK